LIKFINHLLFSKGIKGILNKEGFSYTYTLSYNFFLVMRLCSSFPTVTVGEYFPFSSPDKGQGISKWNMIAITNFAKYLI